MYQHLSENGVSAAESVDSVLEKWFMYNQKLLDFFYQNQDKAVLIHSAEVEENRARSLEKVTRKIGLKFNPKKRKKSKKHALIEAKVIKDPIIEHLAVRIVSENQKVNELYAEMQSVANIFKNNNVKKNEPSTRFSADFSISASCLTYAGSLPPNSRAILINLFVVAFCTSYPAFTEPVKETKAILLSETTFKLSS